MENSSDRPIDSYKQLIDELVLDSTSLGARLVVESNIYSKAQENDELNEFVKSLTDEQRALLARMLNNERQSAIGFVLSTLTHKILCRGLSFQHNGQPMPVDLSGMGLHGDYIGRLDGWEWPSGDGGSQ